MYFNEAEFRECGEFQAINDMFNSHIADNEVLGSLLPENVDLASFYSNYNSLFTKAFTVACGNAFERKLIKEIPIILSSENALALNFLQKQALDRKYHTLFEWKEKNANKFFGLFGPDFKKYMMDVLKNDLTLKQQEKDFVELGELRNLIVHKGIDTYSLTSDLNTIKKMFDNSVEFAVFFCSAFCTYFSESNQRSA